MHFVLERSMVLDRPLAVAFIHPDLGLGGAERLVVDAALELSARGHAVSLAAECSAGWGAMPVAERPGGRSRAACGAESHKRASQLPCSSA